MSVGFCTRCNKTHNWMQAEHKDCPPPRNILSFWPNVHMSADYREALDRHAAEQSRLLTTDEVVQTAVSGHVGFPSQEQWEAARAEQEMHEQEHEEEDEYFDCDDFDDPL